MRGAPLLELLVVLMLGTLLAFPLYRLTRPVPAAPAAVAGTDDAERWETWVDLRFSHAPQAFRLYEDSRLLLEGAEALREDGDVELHPSKGHVRIRLEIEWPETIEQGYVELTVEPADRESRRQGAWGLGKQLQIWEFTWPTH